MYVKQSVRNRYDDLKNQAREISSNALPAYLKLIRLEELKKIQDKAKKSAKELLEDIPEELKQELKKETVLGNPENLIKPDNKDG